MGPVARTLVTSWKLRVISAALLLTLLPGCPNPYELVARVFNS